MAKSSPAHSTTGVINNDAPKAEICGIVMPISPIDNCSEAHWAEVLSIITDAIEKAGLAPNLVSNADEVGVIQKRIIQNLYSNPIVVCDVSGKNPNVMFELGVRVAFDKPVVIIKDDKTPYSFDTANIEHLTYPRDLRFSKIVEFKEKLREKILATHKAAESGEGYTSFLKHFGEFKVAKLDTREVSPEAFLMDEVKQIRNSIARLEANQAPGNIVGRRKVYGGSDAISHPGRRTFQVRMKGPNVSTRIDLLKEMSDVVFGLKIIDVRIQSSDLAHLTLAGDPNCSLDELCSTLNQLLGSKENGVDIELIG